MRQHVPPQQLWNEFHGDLEFEYDHEIYWPAMLKLCAEKQAERRERWIKAGKHFGESETYLKGGNASSIYESTQVAPEVPEKEEASLPAKAAEEVAPV
jgi:hypothetical protein